MKCVGWVAFILIVAILSLYYYQFGVGPTMLSRGRDVWGQFGDYFGGVLNPILSFISILLLIRSVNLQLVANKSLIDENRRQESLDKRKSFEYRFYNLLEAQKGGFNDFYVIMPTPNGSVKYDGVSAVNKIESLVKTTLNRGISGIAITNMLEKLDDQSDDKMFSFFRRFFLIIKLIEDEVCEENGFLKGDKEKYIEVLINLSDFSVVRLFCIGIIYFEWPNVKFIRAVSDIKKVLVSTGLNTYMDELK